MADLTTSCRSVKRARRAASRRSETDGAPGDPPTARSKTEDAAGLLVRFEGGARGVVHALAGQRRAQEPPALGDQRLARRARRGAPSGRRSCGSAIATAPSRVPCATPASWRRTRRRTPALPAGHAEGFGETFRELYRAVYTAVAAGEPPRVQPDYPTFADGHEQALVE